ncbi:MAG: DUF4160 domain-containing protein [Candidatus Sumerlaeota bacterium]|nr:DUF4160 domain-containing protein [Candidatus Sumerlaeota bacterium]
MPVILRVKGYRFWFYEADLREPSHVHVGKGGREAKYWIDPVALARSGGFREEELGEIQRILAEHKEVLLMAWRKEQEKRGRGES